MNTTLENSNNTKKKAALYCRVSTYDQTTGDFSSLDYQEEALKKWCEEEGWEVVEVYREAKSGTTIDRPVLQKLLHDARNSDINLVLMTKIDRLARSAKDWFDLLKDFEKHNVDVNTKSHGLRNDDPYGRLFRNVLIIFAELERDLIAERTYEKALASAEKGKYGGGGIPMGYISTEKGLEVDPHYVEIVNRIFKEYTSGISATKIAAILNKDGLTTPTRVTKSGPNKGKIRGGVQFNSNIVLKVLANRTYLGITKFKDMEFNGIHEAIIDNKLFDLAAKIRKRKARDTNLGVVLKSDLLLLGLLKCGVCGSYMTTSGPTKTKADGTKYKIYYYKCTKQTKYTKSSCGNGQINAEHLEQFVIDWVQGFAKEASFKKATYSKILEANSRKVVNEKKKLRNKERSLSNLNTEKNNLLNLAKSGVDGSLAITEIYKELEVVSEKIAESTKEIKNRKKTLIQLDTQTIDPKKLAEIYQQLIPTLSSKKRDEARKVMALTIKEIVVNKPIGSKETEGFIEIKPWNISPKVFDIKNMQGSTWNPAVLPMRDHSYY
ncbi:MAG: recombinase family protein [Candidatus Marinimicrobia bacterium]|nr:recombinase family protein [Candidatus Neomarinimicrobiota bacterium]